MDSPNLSFVPFCRVIIAVDEPRARIDEFATLGTPMVVLAFANIVIVSVVIFYTSDLSPFAMFSLVYSTRANIEGWLGEPPTTFDKHMDFAHTWDIAMLASITSLPIVRWLRERLPAISGQALSA